MLRTLQASAFLVWLTLVVRPSEFPDPFGLGMALSLTVMCLLAAACVLVPTLFAERWPSTSIDWVLAAYVALLVLSSIGRGNPSNTTAAALLSVAGNIAIFYATVVLARTVPRFLDGVLLLMVVSISLLLLMATSYHAEIGLMTRLGLMTRPTLYPVPQGWSGYPELGMLGVVQFALLFAGLLSASGVPAFLAITALIVVNLIQQVFLYARAAWPTMALVVVAGVALIARRYHFARLVTAVGVVSVVMIGAFATVPTLRFLAVSSLGIEMPAWAQKGYVRSPATPEMRFELWKRAVRLARDHPIRGVGPGNFQQVFESQYNPEIDSEGRRGVHAHNLWLHQFGELGLVGGTTYVALWGLILASGWRTARSRAGFAPLGALLAIVAAFGSNLLTNMFYLTGGAAGRLHALTWVLFGLVAAMAPPGRPSLQCTAVDSITISADRESVRHPVIPTATRTTP